MKEYISQRTMVLVLVISGLSVLVLCAKWGLLDSQALSALVGGLIGSIKSLIDHNGPSDNKPTLPPVVTGAAVGAVLMVGLSLMLSCTPAHQMTGARALHLGSDVCTAIARQAGRADVETVCGLAHDGSEVLQQALVVHVCDLPDAGGQ